MRELCIDDIKKASGGCIINEYVNAEGEYVMVVGDCNAGGGGGGGGFSSGHAFTVGAFGYAGGAAGFAVTRSHWGGAAGAGIGATVGEAVYTTLDHVWEHVSEVFSQPYEPDTPDYMYEYFGIERGERNSEGNYEIPNPDGQNSKAVLLV